MGQNETQRHFELRNLEEDMEKAAKDASRVTTKQTLRRMKTGSMILLFVLVVLVVLACFLLSAF